MNAIKSCVLGLLLSLVCVVSVDKATAGTKDDLNLTPSESMIRSDGKVDKLAETLSTQAIEAELSEANKVAYDNITEDSANESITLKKEIRSLESQVKTLKSNEAVSRKKSEIVQKQVEVKKSQIVFADRELVKASESAQRWSVKITV